MSALSPFGAVSGGAAVRGSGIEASAGDGNAPAGNDGAFAQMIDQGSAKAPASPAKPAQPEKPEKPESATGNQHNASASKASKPQNEKDTADVASDQPQATEATQASTDKPGEESEDADAATPAWPPAGLASLGLQPAAAPLPTAAALPANPLAADTRLPAAANPTATRNPAAAATMATASAAAAVAATPAPALANAATSDPATAADAAALPLLAGASADDGVSTDIATAPAAAGDGFSTLLASAAPSAAARPEAAVFAGSPTAVPDLDDGGFDNALGVRLGWLADQKIGHAHIQINPDNLGPVEVRLQLDGDRVHASFSSAHADVRQALENSLPRLREMLGQQGLQLAQADVGRQQQGQGGSSQANGIVVDGLEGIEGSPRPLSPVALRLRGLLDAYA